MVVILDYVELKKENGMYQELVNYYKWSVKFRYPDLAEK